MDSEMAGVQRLLPHLPQLAPDAIHLWQTAIQQGQGLQQRLAGFDPKKHPATNFPRGTEMHSAHVEHLLQYATQNRVGNISSRLPPAQQLLLGYESMRGLGMSEAHQAQRPVMDVVAGTQTGNEAQQEHVRTGSMPDHPLSRTSSRDGPKSGHQKPRLRWTAELHNRFAVAMEAMGGPMQATPKGLQAIMKVDGLTIYHIKSHLQKYRISSKIQEGMPGRRSKSSSETMPESRADMHDNVTQCNAMHGSGSSMHGIVTQGDTMHGNGSIWAGGGTSQVNSQSQGKLPPASQQQQQHPLHYDSMMRTNGNGVVGAAPHGSGHGEQLHGSWVPPAPATLQQQQQQHHTAGCDSAMHAHAQGGTGGTSHVSGQGQAGQLHGSCGPGSPFPFLPLTLQQQQQPQGTQQQQQPQGTQQQQQVQYIAVGSPAARTQRTHSLGCLATTQSWSGMMAGAASAAAGGTGGMARLLGGEEEVKGGQERGEGEREEEEETCSLASGLEAPLAAVAGGDDVGPEAAAAAAAAGSQGLPASNPEAAAESSHQAAQPAPAAAQNAAAGTPGEAGAESLPQAPQTAADAAPTVTPHEAWRVASSLLYGPSAAADIKPPDLDSALMIQMQLQKQLSDQYEALRALQLHLADHQNYIAQLMGEQDMAMAPSEVAASQEHEPRACLHV